MEKKICVITGGGSGMGLAAAREIGKTHKIVIAGRSAEKLQLAVSELRKEGVEAESCSCDVSLRKSTDTLAGFARSLGKIGVVLNAAGLSPNMGTPEIIMAVNALGTINMHESFLPFLEDKGCLIDVSSMSAHLTPGFIMPKRSYGLSGENPERFMKKMMARVNLFPGKVRSGVAYAISKNFQLDYVRREAARFGAKGVRVLSVSPGNFDTPMGSVEKEESAAYVRHCAIKRLGNVGEIAKLFAMCADEAIGYLTGIDILCDGGCVASGINPLKKKTM